MNVLKLGDVEIHRVVEIDRLPVTLDLLFTNATPEIVAANRDWLGDGLVEPDGDRLFVSHHSFVVRTPALNILVDTCIGNHKPRASMPAWHMLDQPYLERLAAIGLQPEDIDVVMCTHLHADHVGWNTRLVNGQWVPTFPNARYIISRAELAHFEGLHRANPTLPVARGAYQDSVLPVIERGLVELVDPDKALEGELARHVSLENAAGHTPGSMNVHVRAGGAHACLCGDILHHAIQCAEPSLASTGDFDLERAYASRLGLLQRCADTNIDVLAAHFPSPTVGRVVSHGSAFRFVFGA